MKHELLLKLVLRWVGGVSLLALVAVAMPYSWMNATHQWLGLGTLPEQPIVGYLARSLSAFYALLGGLLWFVSFDLARNLPVIRFLGIAMIVFGATLIPIDCAERLPLPWRLLEGPWVVVIGLMIFLLSRRIAPSSSTPRQMPPR